MPPAAATSGALLTEVEGASSLTRVSSAGVTEGVISVVPVMAYPLPASAVEGEVALLMPARPASLIPTVGAGVGKVATGVVRIEPPNGPFGAGVRLWLPDWACTFPAAKIVSAAMNTIVRDISHP